MIGEGVETKDEMITLQDLGVGLMRCYLFAKPGFECLPAINFSALDSARRWGAA